MNEDTVEKNKEQSDLWAKEALEKIQQDGLSPLPDNFAVYYAYFANSNPNLRMAMDALMDPSGKLTQSQCSDLFRAHLGLEAEQKVLSETASSIEDELKLVMSVLNQNSSNTKGYGETLNTFSGALQTTVSLDQIKEAVTRVANETRVMADQNKRLHNQLSQSTQQLTETKYSLDQVKKESLIDPLTQVGNRKYFNNEIQRITHEVMENEQPLSILMADIDHFKKFNDSFGHLIGDQVLRLVARTLIENLKGRDVIARYGGEEFVILLPNTRVPDAIKVADHLRTALGSKQIRRKNTQETLGVVTISLGATEYCPGEDLDSFVARADAALYESKQTGRNKVSARLLSDKEIE